MFCSSLGLVAIVILHVVTVTNIVALVGLTIFSVGFIYPNCFAYALDVFHEKGYASALIGSAILIGVSIISAIVSHFNIDHEYCLSFAFLILSILSILSYVLTRIIIKKR